MAGTNNQHKLHIQETNFNGTYCVESDSFKDHRGVFNRLYCSDELQEIIGDRSIVNINLSMTKTKGTVRGMHFQKPPRAEMKLIRCLKGRVFDVVVDVRKGSPTFLQWLGVELSEANNKMVVIPEGFAHGFQVLEESSELLYLHTAQYSRQDEGALHAQDSGLDIKWPLPISELSDRDCQHVLLSEQNFTGLEL